MNIAFHFPSPMSLVSITLVSFLMLVASAVSKCDPKPIMDYVPGTNNVNLTLSQQYDVTFGNGGGTDYCGPTVFECPNSSSLMFKSLIIKTQKKIKLEQFKVTHAEMDVISFGNKDIPRNGAANDVFTYNPDILISDDGSLGAKVDIIISSQVEITSTETKVEILFQCVKVDPPLLASATEPDEDAAFTSLFLVYVIPVVIFFLLFMMGIIRRCNPYAMAKLKNWGGFTAMDEEEIRNHAGGGTWHDHVDEIITDLKSRGVHEKRADKEEEEEMKGMTYSDKDSASNSGSGSGSEPNNGSGDSNNMSNSEEDQSNENEESEPEENSEDNSDEENSNDDDDDDDL